MTLPSKNRSASRSRNASRKDEKVHSSVTDKISNCRSRHEHGSSKRSFTSDGKKDRAKGQGHYWSRRGSVSPELKRLRSRDDWMGYDR